MFVLLYLKVVFVRLHRLVGFRWSESTSSSLKCDTGQAAAPSFCSITAVPLPVTRERRWIGRASRALKGSRRRLLGSESAEDRHPPHRPGMEKAASDADPSRQRNGFVGALYGEFTDTLDDRVRYSVSLTESALTIQKISALPGQTKVVFNLSDCVGCRARSGPDSADVGAYFTAYFYPFKRRWMSAGLTRQRVEQCFRVALVQDPLVNLQEAERWARAIRDASALQAPRRDGEQIIW